MRVSAAARSKLGTDADLAAYHVGLPPPALPRTPSPRPPP